MHMWGGATSMEMVLPIIGLYSVLPESAAAHIIGNTLMVCKVLGWENGDQFSGLRFLGAYDSREI